MFYFQVIPYILKFKTTKKTFSSIFHTKQSWFIKLYHSEYPLYYGLGECSVLHHINTNITLFEKNLEIIEKQNFSEISAKVIAFLNTTPPIKFAVESAFLDWQNKGKRLLFSTSFTNEQEGIPINGLVWMDTIENQKEEIQQQIDSGFQCIKIKVGQHNIQKDINLIKWIRSTFSSSVEIRLDANGAFSPKDAKHFLEKIFPYNIHSIEQPIAIGQIEQMQELCTHSPIHIALDEELLNKTTIEQKNKLLSKIKPQYIILKPTLLGGFQQSEEWIQIASQYGIKYWITSSLESNVGLSAIAQWTAHTQIYKNSPKIIYQGLSTISLFSNNISTGVYIKKDKLYQKNNHYFTLG